jgi:hypothetical protein
MLCVLYFLEYKEIARHGRIKNTIKEEQYDQTNKSSYGCSVYYLPAYAASIWQCRSAQGASGV